MAQIICLDNYRVLKQTQIITQIYMLINKSLSYRLDSVIWHFDDSFYSLCKRFEMDCKLIKYFQIPVLTFIVTIIIKNSIISESFPKDLLFDNEENMAMFKNSLVKIIESLDESYSENYNRILVEYQLDKIIQKQLNHILLMIPQRIKLN